VRSDHESGVGEIPKVEAVGELPEIGIGMLGYGFMGRAHTNAFRTLAYMTWPPPFVPRLVMIAGSNEAAVAAAARPYGDEKLDVRLARRGERSSGSAVRQRRSELGSCGCDGCGGRERQACPMREAAR
jgi:hypothetical protein